MGEAVPCLRRGDSPGRAGSWDTATLLLLVTDYQAIGMPWGAGRGGGAVESPSRSQWLTQPPNPHQLNSIPIQLVFLECLLCATARELLDAADFQVFGFKTTLLSVTRLALVLRFSHPPKLESAFLLIFGRNPVYPLLSLSR